jgi:hypothetical protein
VHQLVRRGILRVSKSGLIDFGKADLSRRVNLDPDVGRPPAAWRQAEAAKERRASGPTLDQAGSRADPGPVDPALLPVAVPVSASKVREKPEAPAGEVPDEAAGKADEAREEVRDSLLSAKTDHATWQARLAEAEYKKRMGQLLDVGDVRRLVFEVNRSVRDRILAVTRRVRIDLAAAMDPAEVDRVLDPELLQVCTDLSRLELIGMEEVK